MCVCVNMSLSAAEWKVELWKTALVCCQLGCPGFHILSFFTAQIMKNIIISGQKKKVNDPSNLCKHRERDGTNSNRNTPTCLLSLLRDGFSLSMKNQEIYINGKIYNTLLFCIMYSTCMPLLTVLR